MSLRLPKHHLILTMICLGFTLLVAVLYQTESLIGHAELMSQDRLLTGGGSRHTEANPQIVLLSIDEPTRTLDTLFADDLEKSSTLRLMKQAYPWKDRQIWADIIDRVCDAGAAAVIIDAVFPEEKQGDDAFRAALIRHADKVVLGSKLQNKQYILPTSKLIPPPDRPSWLGFVSVRADEDGLVRRVSFRTSFLEFFGIPSPDGVQELLSLDARGLEKAGWSQHIPTGHKPVMLRFGDTAPPHSLHEIFVDPQWEAPPYNRGELFRNKIVVIGEESESSEDRMFTPQGVAYGVDIHLNALNCALNDTFVRELPASIDIALIVLGGLVAWALGAWVRRPIVRLVAIAAAAAAYFVIAQNVTNNFDLLPTLLSPILALTASGITWATWEQILDRVERQRLRRTFERYVSKDIVRELLDNPASYLNSLGGVRKEITVLFSDVRSFTTLTETADPHALVGQLNEYFEEMVAIVFANHGTLDKFIGDAVMAHWGSMVSEGASVDAARALTTVLQMRQALARLNPLWRQRGMPEMRVGFGVNHSEAIVGNLGCEAKMEVSVIGDAVNLGSRLEGVTKQYRLDLCIGENVANLIRDQFIIRSVDLIVVQGKTRPVEIFTVLEVAGAPEPAWLPGHEEAVRLYRKGEFVAAEKAWREVLAQAPGDGIAETFIARCAELQKNPPAPPWSGVYEMKSK